MPFDQGLRLHDNPALLEACSGASHMYPIFIIDPFFLRSGQYKCVLQHTNHPCTCTLAPGMLLQGVCQPLQLSAAVTGGPAHQAST
jgi:hypothetical protein